jgi:alpha-tubulin suppressor-like RCC1 family protein
MFLSKYGKFSFFRDVHGNVYGCGANDSGQLGLGDTVPRCSPTQIQNLNNIKSITAGATFAVALDSEGHLWSMGQTSMLGRKQSANGAYLPGRIRLPEIQSIHAGKAHVICMSKQESKVYFWGDNSTFQSGSELDRGKLTEFFYNPTIPVHMNNISLIGAGESFSLASRISEHAGDKFYILNNDSTLRRLINTDPKMPFEYYGNGWPLPGKWKRYTQASRIRYSLPILEVQGGVNFIIVLTYGQLIYSLGVNTYGQLGICSQDNQSSLQQVPMDNPVTHFSVGSYHTLLLDTERKVFGFGKNIHGELGLGNNENARVPLEITGIPPCKFIAAGSCYSMVLDEYDCVWVFGDNAANQLGLGPDQPTRFYLPYQHVLLQEMQILVSVETQQSSLVKRASNM